MTLICPNVYPNKPEGFFLDPILKQNLDILADNIVNDQDFVLLISGNGKVRIGKSVMGMQLGAYLTNKVNEITKGNNIFSTDNYVFRGKDLINKAKDMPKYSVIVYDEAGADLVGRKVMMQSTQAVLDLLREIGQLNLFLILILPDFFELPKAIAITRSVMLVDVNYREKFTRGLFRLFGWKRKKALYLAGKRYLDYDAVKPDHMGSFTNFYTIDEEKYRSLKFAALTGRTLDDIQKKDKQNAKWTLQRNLLIRYIYANCNLTQEKIGALIGLTSDVVSRVCSDETY